MSHDPEWVRFQAFRLAAPRVAFYADASAPRIARDARAATARWADETGADHDACCEFFKQYRSTLTDGVNA